MFHRLSHASIPRAHILKIRFCVCLHIQTWIYPVILRKSVFFIFLLYFKFF